MDREPFGRSASATLASWRLRIVVNFDRRARRDFAPDFFPTPHPSWRNNGWLRKHPWFETELLPSLREAVEKAVG